MTKPTTDDLLALIARELRHPLCSYCGSVPVDHDGDSYCAICWAELSEDDAKGD